VKRLKAVSAGSRRREEAENLERTQASASLPRRLRILNPVLRTALFFFAAMLCAFTVRSEPAPRTFLNSGYGFKMVLTEDWDNLPETIMTTLNEAVAKVQPDWPRPALQSGYWMTNAGGFVFSPYAIIRVTEPGYPLDEKTIRAEWKEKALLAPDAELEDPVLDKNLNALVAKGRATLQNDVPVAVSVAVFQTRVGAIKILCYAAQKDVESHPDLFAQILKGVRLDEDRVVGWKPSKTGLWIGLASIGLIAFALWRAKPASEVLTTDGHRMSTDGKDGNFAP
jgi:hypothetical protein